MSKKDYVLGFIFNPEKTEIALIRKDRPSWQKGALNAIGGKIENGESPLKAMVRENKEETSVLIPEDNWKEFAFFSGDWGSVTCFKTSFFNLKLLHCNESESIEVHKINNVLNHKRSDDLWDLICEALKN